MHEYLRHYMHTIPISRGPPYPTSPPIKIFFHSSIHPFRSTSPLISSQARVPSREHVQHTPKLRP